MVWLGAGQVATAIADEFTGAYKVDSVDLIASYLLLMQVFSHLLFCVSMRTTFFDVEIEVFQNMKGLIVLVGVDGER